MLVQSNIYKCLCLYLRFYLGATPAYLIADPNMLKQIMVTEFSNFTDRVPVRKYLHTLQKQNCDIHTNMGMKYLSHRSY